MDTTPALATGDRVRRHVTHVMGMPISVALRGREADTTSGAQAWDAVIEELRKVDLIFSTYRDDSVINRLGRGELALRDCPPDVADVLALGQRAEQESGGAFSVRLPLDPARPTGPRRLDPSGVVKGWAADRASRHLAALADTDFCLSAGGDIVCRAAAQREPWRIGIENPHDPTRVIAVVPLHHGAVATSGSTHRGAHLVDSRTGRPAVGVATVTVVGPSLTWADIDATAACALGTGAPDWLRTRPVHSSLVVWPDGRVEQIVPGSGPTGQQFRSAHTSTHERI